ncbi:MAG: hypothetical protein WCH52_11120 [Bacteroidota bacterium]
MKKISIAFLLLSLSFISVAQPVRKIGLFVPLYLDSVFHGNDYRYGKKFPRYALQGLDFVQGAQIALDSFPISNCIVELFVYDSKSDSVSVKTLIDSQKLDSLELIIGAVKDDELNLLASFAKSKKIPFISATYPNDGGIVSNPYYVILNSTLRSHCEAIFSYLLQNHHTENIIHVRQTGSQEDRVAGYLNNINKPDNKPLLKIKTMNLDSNLILIKTALDSTKKNFIIGGSLDEDFVGSIANILSSVSKTYDITLIGMPNWDGFTSFGKNHKENLKDFPIYFTSPYFNYKTDNYSKIIQDAYLKNYKGKPSDFAYKGFEVMYVFSRLLNLYPVNLIEHLNDYPFKVFSDFNIVPIKSNNQSSHIDYQENKHLFFIKKVNGTASKAW